jgi:hypothetical protein
MELYCDRVGNQKAQDNNFFLAIGGFIFFGSKFTPAGGELKPPSQAGTIPSGVPAFSLPIGVRSLPKRAT